MMTLKVIGSSSKGNGYLLDNGREALLLECGVKIHDIKKAAGFDVGKIAGCLITHEHADHAGHAHEVMRSGIDIYSSRGTLDKLKLTSHRAMVMRAKSRYQIGHFTVMPFDVRHDAAEPFGFLISHPECGNTLFTTDTYYLPFTFPGLNNIIAEVNYDIDILNENVFSGRIPPVVRKRVLESHMEIGTFLDFLRANDLTTVNNIVMIHLSDGNSNAKTFTQKVKNLTGKSVHVADAGMVINIEKTPF